MQYIFSILWLALGGTWISAVIYLGHMVGGVQWLIHTGQGRPAAMNILMAMICVVAAIKLGVTKKLHIAIIISATVVILVHLVNAFGIYLMYESNGRIFSTDPWLMLPFRLLAMAIPTNTVFTGKLSGNHVFFILPIASAALLAASVFISTFGRSRVERTQ